LLPLLRFTRSGEYRDDEVHALPRLGRRLAIACSDDKVVLRIAVSQRDFQLM
jgi:hypothetical protein